MLLKLLFAHGLGDYFLQTDYLAINKGKTIIYYVFMQYFILLQ